MHARHIVTAVALIAASAASTAAQDIAQRVRSTEHGTVRLVFASRPGTCGDGGTFISTQRRDEQGNLATFRQTRSGWNTTTTRSDPDARSCAEGPVWVDLSIQRGAVTALETFAGARPPEPAHVVNARAAVDYLLSLARSAPPEIGRRAILPVILADSVEPWPGLLDLAKDEQVARPVRKAAIFWVGQAAGARASDGLKSLLSDDDREIKKQAVFALSQLRASAGVTALIDVVRTNRDAEVRKSALFWLAQKEDPRVIALLEEILLR